MANGTTRPFSDDGLLYRISELERRIERIESSSVLVKLAVLEETVKSLGDDSRSLRRGFYTLSFSVVGAAILTGIGVTQL